MGATRRVSRRMQRRDLNKVRKAISRETDRRVAQLIEEQTAVVQSAADGWDWFSEGQASSLPGEVH